METGGGKVRQGTGVIVVQVRDHNVLNGCKFNTDPGKCLLGRLQQFPVSLPRFLQPESCVYHDRALVVSHHPQEIVDGHRRIVIICQLEVIRPGPIRALRITKCEDFVKLFRGHECSPQELLALLPIPHIQHTNQR